MSIKLAIRVAISAALFLVAFFIARGDLRLEVVERLEYIAYDMRLGLSLEHQADERIVIVDIDERSLAAEGHWPWPRARLAELIDTLFDEYAVLALGVDVAWPEPERTAASTLIDRIEALLGAEGIVLPLEDVRLAVEGDRRLAASLEGREIALGYVFRQVVHPGEPATVGALPSPVIPDGVAQNDIQWVEAAGYSGNLSVLQSRALHAGYFSQPAEAMDSDGVYRRMSMLQAYGGDIYEALSLATLRVANRMPDINLVFAGDGTRRTALDLEWVEIGGLHIPLDETMSARVPYRGGPFTFDYVSATDVLTGAAPIEKLFGRIALLGTSAPGLYDLRATPAGSAFAGVEVHANMISGILDGRVKHSPPWILAATVLQLVLLTILMTVVVIKLPPLPAVTTAFVVGILVVAADQLLWRADLVAPLALPLVLTLALFVAHITWGFFVESRTKRHLSKMFGQYVPQELVAEMELNPTPITMEGENRDMSVLFSDIRGFTTLSEALDPRELSDLMNEYLTEMTRVIYEHRGTVDKYMGDAIMAFWGAPLREQDHARLAVEAGFAMLEASNRVSWRFVSRRWPEIKIGVGISSGQMSVGNMGSEFRTAYTVLGDVVNLGSRLEGLTKNYGVSMIVSAATREAVPGQAWRELDVVRVKGKSEPIAIYEPLGALSNLHPDVQRELEVLETALAAYRGGDWEEAKDLFRQLLVLAPDDGLYTLYLKRIEYFERNPPAADWDGVFTHETK